MLPPRKPHNRLSAYRIHALRNGIQVVLEQVRVGVERHGCGRVAEHPLDRLGVRAGADRDACGRVPEIVRSDLREARLGGTRRLYRVPEPPLSATGTGEVGEAVAESLNSSLKTIGSTRRSIHSHNPALRRYHWTIVIGSARSKSFQALLAGKPSEAY